MSSRSHLALLVLAFLLFLGAAWFWLQPQPGPPVAGSACALPPENAAGGHALPPTNKQPEAETGLPALKPAPPPPEVPNDPAKGEVWLRVLDAATNQPLSGVECDLWWVTAYTADRTSAFHGGDGSDGVLGDCAPKRRQATAAGGLLRLSATPEPVDLLKQYRELESGKLKPDDLMDVNYGEDQTGLRLLYPLPPGYEPVTQPHELGQALVALREKPTTQPVDVLVGSAPSLTGRVTDASGAPVANAHVAAFPVLPTPETYTWTYFRSAAYREFGIWDWGGPLSRPDPVSEEALLRQHLRYSAGEGYAGFVDPPTSLLAEVVGVDTPPAGRIPECYETSTNGDGEYSLPRLISGRWLVLVCERYHSPATRAVVLRRCPAHCDIQLSALLRGALRIELIG